MEQAAFLLLKGEDRNERDGDDQQTEEQRRTDFDGGSNQYLGTRHIRRCPFEALMGVFDHHDSRVHHGTDGDGDAAQAHDVGAQPQRMHGDESDQNTDRQRDDGHQGTAEMHQEDEAHQCNDHAFLK